MFVLDFLQNRQREREREREREMHAQRQTYRQRWNTFEKHFVL